MVHEWEAGRQYEVGEVVIYEDVKYRNIQAHRSQNDWVPSVTPALWGRMGRAEAECHARGEEHNNRCHEDDEGKKWHEQTEQKVEIDEHEKKKQWWDLDDKRKKELEVGGGLAAGAGLIAAGIFAYHHHEQSQERKKAEAWALGNWLEEARARTRRYRSEGETSSVTWVLVESGGEIPQNAIAGDDVGGETLYVARSYQDGGLHPGKCGSHLRKGCVIGYAGKAIEVEVFEVLVGVRESVRFVPGPRPFSAERIEGSLVEGGNESDGTKLYIAKAPYKGVSHLGKVREQLKGAIVAVDGKEETVVEYEVLVFA